MFSLNSLISFLVHIDAGPDSLPLRYHRHRIRHRPLSLAVAAAQFAVVPRPYPFPKLTFSFPAAGLQRYPMDLRVQTASPPTGTKPAMPWERRFHYPHRVSADSAAAGAFAVACRPAPYIVDNVVLGVAVSARVAGLDYSETVVRRRLEIEGTFAYLKLPEFVVAVLRNVLVPPLPPDVVVPLIRLSCDRLRWPRFFSSPRYLVSALPCTSGIVGTRNPKASRNQPWRLFYSSRPMPPTLASDHCL